MILVGGAYLLWATVRNSQISPLRGSEEYELTIDGHYTWDVVVGVFVCW